MTLNDALSVISGSTRIIIFVGQGQAFNGKMCEASKSEWEEKMNPYMDNDVIRINNFDGAITIAV